MEEWPENPEIAMSVLRLMEDLSQNQQERLKFDLNSCSAVLLFKEMAKIIISYGWCTFLPINQCFQERNICNSQL